MVNIIIVINISRYQGGRSVHCGIRSTARSTSNSEWLVVVRTRLRLENYAVRNNYLPMWRPSLFGQSYFHSSTSHCVVLDSNELPQRVHVMDCVPSFPGRRTSTTVKSAEEQLSRSSGTRAATLESSHIIGFHPKSSRRGLLVSR